jgi:hypothetical protein
MPLKPPASRTLDPAWLDAMQSRISSRRYNGEAIDAALLDRLDRTCQRLSDTEAPARAVLVRQAPPEVFTGLVGSYGRVEDSPSLVAFVGAGDAAHDIGYVGEAVILEATLLGLDTCWIAASFDPERAGRLAELGEGERVHAITALGHATDKTGVSEKLMRASLRARKRLPMDTIAPGHGDWPAWAREAAAALRLAPSGANKQPWRLHMDGDALVITEAPKVYWTAPIDFGIAMLHAELGAEHAGVSGRWTTDRNDEVARFVPHTAS